MDTLSMYYNSQFVMNEEWANEEKGLMLTVKPLRGPVLDGTVVGSIQYRGEAVQTFAVQSNGTVNLREAYNPPVNPERFVVSGHGDKAGSVTLVFNEPVSKGDVKVTLSYEYTCC